MSKTKDKKKPGAYKLELTAASMTFWGVFLFFLLTWIFVLGIFVGRGFLPGSTFTDMKAMWHEITGSAKNDNQSEPKSINEDPKLAFYEKLASKKEEVIKSQLPEKKKQVPTKITLLRRPSEKKVNPSAVQAPVKEATSSTYGNKYKYSVQVASISNMERAEKLVKDLVDKGYDAYYYTVVVMGKKYYRVRCGRFYNRDNAQKYLKKLEKGTGYKGLVLKFE